METPTTTPTASQVGESATATLARLQDDVALWRQRHELLRASLKELETVLREFDRDLGRHARHLAREPAPRSARRHVVTARRNHGSLAGRHREIRYRLMRLTALMEHVTAPLH